MPLAAHFLPYVGFLNVLVVWMISILADFRTNGAPEARVAKLEVRASDNQK